MKVEKVEIKNFRSIGESCFIILDAKSTVLVGKSNVGKSNVLKAIKFAFNNESLPEKDICSWNKSETSCINIVFRIEDSDIPFLEKINPNLKKTNSIILKKYVDGNQEFAFEPELTFEIWNQPSNDVINNLKNYRARIRKTFRDFKSKEIDNTDQLVVEFILLEEWVNEAKNLNEKKSENDQKIILNEFLRKLKILRKLLDKKTYSNYELQGIKRIFTNMIYDINNFIPNVKYIEQKSKPFDSKELIKLLPQIVFLESDEELKITESIIIKAIRSASEKNFMKGLVGLANIDLDTLEKGDGREIAELLNEANKNISEKLSKFWNQENLRIELRDDIDESSKKILELDIIGGEERRSSIFDQSPGTQWFLAFVVLFLSNQSYEKGTLLILDEPGTRLHAGAQYDLLDRFENTNTSIQIVYATQSPYMINKNFPLRVKSVEKGNGKTTTRGTYVNLKPYASQKGIAWEPIRTAIGLPAGASLYVAGKNLIVEGITDNVIIGSLIQCINKLENITKFDLNKVCVTFACSERNLISLSLFCHQETKNTKVLLDGDTGSNIKKNLVKEKFPEDRIFILSDIIKSKIDIEDLFDEEFYHNCVLEAYKELRESGLVDKLPQNWKDIEKCSEDKENLTKNWGRSKFYDEYFNINKAEIGRFDKVIVAKKIAISLLTMEENELRKIVKNFETVLNKIWAKDPNWF